MLFRSLTLKLHIHTDNRVKMIASFVRERRLQLYKDVINAFRGNRVISFLLPEIGVFCVSRVPNRIELGWVSLLFL